MKGNQENLSPAEWQKIIPAEHSKPLALSRKWEDMSYVKELLWK